jgi:hypothetical protein
VSENIVAAAYGSTGPDATEVQRILRRLSAMKGERSTWDPTLRDISDFIAPRRGRFFVEDRNRGDRKDRRIINNRATRAARVMTSGLMSYLTNPARPWLRLTTPDPDLNEFEPVKVWMSTLVERLSWVFQRSNFYQALHGLYADLLFGTAAMHIEEDTRRVIRCYLYPIGSYWVANGQDNRVNTVYREFQMTAAQMVERFGISKVSRRCKDAFAESRKDEWFTVLHALEPNVDLQTGKLGRAGMSTRSWWLEYGPNESKFLSAGGYSEFPVMAPRWDTTGEDIYGNGPGHEAIGDARALQTLERRKAQFIDKLANPAMQMPSALRGEPVSMNPNSHVFVDATGPAQAVRPVYEPNAAGLTAIEASIREHEKRIDQAMRADLWLVMEQLVEGKMTATEVVQRREEKGLQLGPTLHRLEDELLNPMVDRVVPIILRRGLMPPPPQELQGMEVRAEFISVLAQAQKVVGIQGVQELSRYVGIFAQMQMSAQQPPTALDKFDFDQAIDDIGDMLGTPTALVRSDDKVEALRAQRAKAQQEQQALQQAQQMAETAKTAAGADLEGDNVLSRMLPAVAGNRGA